MVLGAPVAPEKSPKEKEPGSTEKKRLSGIGTLSYVVNQRLDDSPFAERLVFKDSPRGEDGKIQRRLDAQNQFGEVAAYRRALLEPVPGKTVGKVEPFKLRPLAGSPRCAGGLHGKSWGAGFLRFPAVRRSPSSLLRL